MWFPRPAEEFSDDVFEYIDKKIEEWTARSLAPENDEDSRACFCVLEVLEEMRNYFCKYPYWE